MSTVEQVGFSEIEVREQLDRISQSNVLKRSRRLQQFLRYITDLTLAGEESNINEYLLGVEVFERGPNYNASEDSVVRRQAHALRHKLGEYYATEGKDDPIRIEIPLGHYVPVFHRNEEKPGSESREAGPHVAAAAEQPQASYRFVAVIAMLAIVGMGVAFWLGSEFGAGLGRDTALIQAPAATPAINELWAPWFASEQAPQLVFSTPMTAVIKHFALPLPPDSEPPRLEVPQGLQQPIRDKFNLNDGGYLYMTPTVSETKSGESLGAVHLAILFASRGLPVRATTSARLTWEGFRQENLILFGHNEQNTWMDPLLADHPFRLEKTNGGVQRRIAVTNPRPDEPRYFQIEFPPDAEGSRSEYALVSMLPGTDGLRELLLVSGLNTQATLMAVEFLTNEDRAAQLIERLRAEAPDHQGSWYFQLVLKAEVRGSVPTGGTIELLRVLN